ncbi:MAG: T9SS type A sorting domain-containing protein, partial [Chitinophagales bacterium]
EGDEINFEGDGYEYSTNSSKGFFILRYYLDSDSCSADTIDIAIDDIQNIKYLNMYPNPSAGNFRITFIHEISGECVLSIHDVQGAMVYLERKYFPAGNVTQPVGFAAAAGVYTVKVVTEKNTYAGRLIIE